MNDKEFRENCKVLANDIIDFHAGWKKSLTVPTDWVGVMEDTRQLDTAALLYIAANMPNLNDEKKKQEMENNKSLIDVGDIVQTDDTLYLLIEAPDDYELVDLDLDKVELGNYETPMEAQKDLDRIYGVNNYRIIKKNDFMKILNEIED